MDERSRLRGRWWAGSGLEARNVRALVAQTSFAGIVEGGITTYLPVMLARLGATASTVALMNVALALVTTLAAIPAAALMARQRRPIAWSARPFLLMRGLFLLIALAVMLPPSLAIPAAIGLWALAGIPAAIVNTAFVSVLPDAVSPGRLSAVNGLRWAMLGVVMAIATAAFGAMLDRIASPTGYQLVFALSAVGGAVGVWFYARIEVPDREPTDSTLTWRERFAGGLLPEGSGAAFREFSLLAAIVRVGLHLPVGLFSVFWVNELEASDGWIGLRSAVANGMLPVAYVAWGWLAARLDYRWIFGLSAIGFSLYPALTAVSPTVEWLLPAAFFWGVFVAGFDFALVEGLLRVSPAPMRPRLVAANTVQANLIMLTAPLIGAWSADVIGIRAVMLVAGGLHLIVGVALIARRLRARRLRTLEPGALPAAP